MIGGIFRYVQGIVKLRGGSDLTIIGNNGDRLKVDTIVNLAPAEDVLYEFPDLLNGSETNQNVNGSVTPVNFDFAPVSGTYFIEEVNFMIGDVGQNNHGNYGAIAGSLTNGCELKIKSNGVEYVVKVLKNNADITMTFASSSIAVPAGAWLEDIDSYRGGIEFKFPTILDSAQGDYVRMTIRDNLTGLSLQRMQLRVWRDA